ncbi:hypothetical protein H257_06534 [Aphanomyces astaci]|uniref:Plastocyanin-like domain-containing protein n=1 Tax=Aphanomyces astaci TaxID=112090 RepID=W4GMC5_APHAT|nr:hypothetical protein H257_06534 [Aphanomyces astaci]ETV80169.1 hypothetical protein H257_06534 [Aphanomyces astaci]RQM21767.1 hypothetical protein B5M09_009453 [Aphanomyces astaci]|eukprot:XP_009830093.1 hypothetical protein H257_06534 [Aphanomyces astaci]
MANLKLPCCGLFGGLLGYLFQSNTVPDNAPSSPHYRPPLLTNWHPYTSPLVQPEVIDMRGGGHLDMYVGEVLHAWGSGAPSGTVYGFGREGSAPSFPGPTILTARNVPISVTWTNRLGTAPHLLHRNTEPSFLVEASACYPTCGVPTSVHIHGLENPPKYDGMPTQTFYHNTTFKAKYANRQFPSTKVYHDHAWGLSQLNMWAGMVGLYAVQDAELESKFHLDKLPDMTFILQDKLISADGALLYTEKLTCSPVAPTKWVPQAYGSVNTVNGVVMPFATIDASRVRFRWANVANARTYTLTLPFAHLCKVVATDGGFVHRPSPVPVTDWTLFPLERVEMVCDFTSVPAGTTFDIVDKPLLQESAYVYDARVMQVQITSSQGAREKQRQVSRRPLPDTLVALKSLRQLHVDTLGMTRQVTLGELMDGHGCSTHLYLQEHSAIKDATTIKSTLHCTLGKVEKWEFINPTVGPHPFHWHLVNAQCGETEATINTNELKDVVVIPARPDGGVALVCYVACTPDEFLLVHSTRSAHSFGFNVLDDPYLAHCHIMEHGENQMMAWFQLTAKDVDN